MNDKIPDGILEEFIESFPGITSAVHNGWSLGFPTIWFTCYFSDELEITLMINRLAAKGIKHYQDNPNRYDSLSSILTTTVIQLIKMRRELAQNFFARLPR
jgi:hypothetical protein